LFIYIKYKLIHIYILELDYTLKYIFILHYIFMYLYIYIRGSFEKSVQSPRVDATGACRGYLQLVVSLGITHNKFQPDRSISLCLAFV